MSALPVLLAEEEASPTRSRLETALGGASRRGDVVRRERLTPDEAQEPSGEAVGPEDSEGAEADPDDVEGPEEDLIADEPSVPPPLVDPHTVRIVDEDGRPIPGVPLHLGGDRWASTGESGEATVDAAGLAGPVTFFDGERRRAIDLGEPTAEVQAAAIPRLEVSVVDARTGIALDPVPYEFRLAFGESRRAWTGGLRPAVPVAEDGETCFSVAVDPPVGYGGFERVHWHGTLAVRTRTVRLVVPVFETTERTFRVRLPGGDAARGAIVLAAWVGSRPAADEIAGNEPVTFRAEPADADGVLRLRGLPKVPFTRLGASFTSAKVGSLLGATVDGIDLFAPAPGHPLEVLLSTAGSYRGPSGAVPGCGREVSYDGPTASLEVLVLDRQGDPARRVLVRTGSDAMWTAADGRCRFTGLPVGRTALSAASVGYLPTVIEADVGSVESVEIREAASRTVRVLVRDEDGDPVPSASVDAWSTYAPTPSGGWIGARTELAQIDGDSQDAVARTDRIGEVLLEVPRFEVEYRAWLGEAMAEAKSAGDEVVLVLRDPNRQ